VSWLLFLDEPGHDHKNCPYEVRGGISIHASKVWPFVQQLQAAEFAAFGASLREYSKELKGSQLLNKDRFRWAAQAKWMPDEARRRPGVQTQRLPLHNFQFTSPDNTRGSKFRCGHKRYSKGSVGYREKVSWMNIARLPI
jgi:hypothetical protein